MISVLETCQPRTELLKGKFNPEIFTASLGPILSYYRSGQATVDTLYTNAELFFREATYPTQGLKLALSEVFARLAGDVTVPAIHRLETAFGGGKTHTLIACAHIAFRGKELKEVTAGLLEPDLLPDPGSVAVVGVAGDEIPVHKPKGEALVPYTLWGEIAYQVGGEELYRAVSEEAQSHAAPGKTYFEKVLGGRRVLIMLDELAQYAARLEAARPDGASQLAAFLMSLHGYARNHPGIAIVLTLASAADAFARQTERLTELLAEVKGEEISADEALSLGHQAVRSVASVVSRDAVQITPVQGAEISSVLAKRLFTAVDRAAARETAEAYLDMYRRNSADLPVEAISEGYRDRIIANYPFHPTLIDFLNQKLANAENFQGTRGVLRVLSLVVRSIWENKLNVPMIHACHFDLRSARVVDELLGRTGSGDLLPILNADVGGVDTGGLEGGKSNAQLADEENPHPEGYPLYEYTWKTVFLHSLVGRELGLGSNIFGLTESDALFAVAFPGMTPAQVRMALEEIPKRAYYLKYEQGRYFASDTPTLNSVLARIRRTIGRDALEELVAATARKLVKTGEGIFHVEHDVTLPEHLPEGKGRPVLGIVSPLAGQINLQAMFTTRGANHPRLEQNGLFLLVPDTVRVVDPTDQKGQLYFADDRPEQELNQLLEIARQVKAMRMLRENPLNWGVKPQRLDEDEFKQRQSERENALATAVARAYTSLYFPAAGTGKVIRKELRSAGGEGGAPIIQEIRRLLVEDKELLTSADTGQSDLVNLSHLFFAKGDVVSLKTLRTHFATLRPWPVLESPAVLDQLIRVGVQKKVWCVFRMDDAESTRPTEFYFGDQEIPMAANLNAEGYSLVTPQGAKQRGWMDADRIDPAKVRDAVYTVVADTGMLIVSDVVTRVNEKLGETPAEIVEEAAIDLVKQGRLYIAKATTDETGRSDLIGSTEAVSYVPALTDVLVTPAEAAQRGWVTEKTPSLTLTGRAGADKLIPLFHQLGSIYNRGASTRIDTLDVTELVLPHGGYLRLQLSDVTPESMKALGELFEVLATVTKQGDRTEAFLVVKDPDDNCPFVKALRDNKDQQ